MNNRVRGNISVQNYLFAGHRWQRCERPAPTFERRKQTVVRIALAPSADFRFEAAVRHTHPATVTP